MKQQLSALVFCLAMLSCGKIAKNSMLSSIVYNPTRWPDPQAIPLCFLNQAELSPELVSDLKATLINEYHGRTNVRFARLDDCTPQDAKSLVVRVLLRKVYDWDTKGGLQAGGGLSFIGPNASELGGDDGGSSLRVDVGSSGNYPPPGHPLRLFAINQTRSAFIHEVGHAVGLAHEHERADAPRCNDMQGSLGNDATWVFVGAYDPNSIMNYCRSYTISTLSAGDIAGIAYLYPKGASPLPPLGNYTIKAKASGRCLDVKDSSNQMGLWDCVKDSKQSYRLLDAGGGSYYLQNERLGSCLGVAAALETDGAKVVLESCRPIGSQRVYLEAVAEDSFHLTFAHTNKCLAPADQSAANGTDLMQTACQSDNDQLFRFEPVPAGKR